jgi:hypothetical protein
MNIDDIKSLSEKARLDGKRLFRVCELIWTVTLVVNWIAAIVGLTAAFVVMYQFNFWAGFGVAVFTTIACFIYYMLSVLSTHVAKVMVHTSFATVGLLEHFNKSEAGE